MTEKRNPLRRAVSVNYVLALVLVGILGFLALQIYTMPDKFVTMERYQADQSKIRAQYLLDQANFKYQYSLDQSKIEDAVCEIRNDIKEILKRLK